MAIHIEFNGSVFVPTVSSVDEAKRMIWMYRGQAGKPAKGNAETAAQRGKWSVVEDGRVVYSIDYGNTNDRTKEAARR